jgi:ABC-2 type transport system ATP-binding protein
MILKTIDISKSYGDYKALDGVSIEIERGSIFGLLGPNGAGKTTLIRILTNITAPDSGGLEFSDDKLKIGYLPEERGLYRKMKVWEQAVYLTQLKGLSKGEAEKRLKPWFERLSMQGWINKRVDELSKGMQQKLQFVITVAHEPEVLILDEPFSGFDPVNAEELKKEILRINESGTTVILSTHNMTSVEELCESICLINQGKVILNGNLQEIKNQFGSSIFEIEFSGSQMALANAIGHQFELVKLVEKNERIKAEIRGDGSVSSNQLLNSLIQHIEIYSFRKLTPSMNDIFIDLVKGQEVTITES